MHALRELNLADEATARAVHRVGRAAYAVEAELIGFPGIPALSETLAQLRAQPCRWLGALPGEGTPTGPGAPAGHGTCTADGAPVREGARAGGPALAAFVAWSTAPEGVTVERVCVCPAWFRHGLATRLLRHLLDALAPAGDVRVTTGAANAPALALYSRLGFTRQADVRPEPGLTLARFVLRR
ncbi:MULTISPECIES: GNAT family N-acetyltransferase [Streptomyces]|uniref:GNAT family N-acetyltransferase n=1 Tax=Streptomyces TaxID=1883 RepID=UPI002248A8F4|nr:GNAT family N-acetyltransferase [Streptomyces sp. JHD 1]MCX2967321.1 GNAT family N-acetyltransferase [Streptomyces sp. JHD 1]